jgi:hypothetical protein
VSGGEYALGVGLLAVLASSAVLTGWSARRLLLPDWSGPPARLAESIAGVAALILVAELLGGIGAFRRWPIVLTVACVAAVAVAATRRFEPTTSAEPEAPPGGSLAVAVAAIAVTWAVTRAMQSALDAFHSGMLSFDTLWYHLPFAVRFVQDGSLTHLYYVGNAPTTFYPASGEVVHALGMLLLASDFLSPVINVGWLALALLAGWCVGRPYGVAPATMVATCLVVFLPVMGGAQAGTAGTDVAVLALLLAAVALVVNGRGALRATGLAAVAGGLAIGTKLDAWAPVVALAALSIVLARRRRWGVAAGWLGGVTLAGGFWYIRNLATVGNPFPWFGLRIAGVVAVPSTSAPVDCGQTAVASYVANPTFLSAHILPQLPSALGARWWLVAGLAAAGAGAGLLSSRPSLRGLGAVAAFAAAAYLLTPATAGGHDASCFGFNTRFATPALALGLIVLPLSLAPRRHGPVLSVLVLAIALMLTVHPSRELGPLLAVLVLVAAAGFLYLSRSRRILPRHGGLALAGALLLLVVLAGRHQEQAYAQSRFVDATFSDPVGPIAGRLRGAHNARIAVAGLTESYPLDGPDLSNRVDYPARLVDARFQSYSTCRSWLRALRAGRYDYVVTAREGATDSRAAGWTRRYPGARELLSSAPGATSRGVPWTWQLFSLDPARGVEPRAACE